MDRGTQAIKDASRNNSAVAMLMMNIDHFQQVNDKYGYAVGDKVLQRIAALLGSMLRSYDTISRQGGDEFVVILPMISDAINIAEFCTRIKSDFAQLWKTKEFAFDLTLCIGVSMFPEDCDNVHQLYQRAHTAMHEAKRIEKNSIHFFSKELELRVKHQQQQVMKLQEAVKNNEIILFYQPKVDSNTSEILGFEALARWPQKDGSMIFPDAFIPLAEETKLIIPLGEKLLEQACAQTVEWQKQHPKLHVSVNLSAVQFTSQLVKTVQKVIANTGIKPECLELEITESVLLNDEYSLATFNKLKELGIKISIDDFGTGYSSLSYIKKYALDVLKIDQSFVRNMFEEKIDITIIQTIITLAKNLEISLIAEGVETQRHAELLKDLGCDILQGYYFGRPVSTEETSHILAATGFIKP
jgi:diguanylate cyclase (GGDEF)-like protein